MVEMLRVRGSVLRSKLSQHNSHGILQLTSVIFHLVLFLGAGFTVASILYFVPIMLSKRKKGKSYHGLFKWIMTKNSISVNHYKYSEEIVRYFEAAFAENQDIKRIWDKSFEKKSQLKTDKEEETINLDLQNIIVLNALSLHLNTYFNHAKFKKKFKEEE